MDISLLHNHISVNKKYSTSRAVAKSNSIQSQKDKNVAQTSASARTKADQEEQHIEKLLIKLPKLAQIFNVHRKIGEGTFSSVFLGTLKCDSHMQEKDRKQFAIKHLVPTSHPSRIEQELKCLRDIGGRDNVIGVDLCLRHLNTVVFIMPYIPHRKFSEYVLDMDARETMLYMRALLQALCRVHQHGVIHRDVKPSNFLYDRDNQRYLLVDFGLAQRVYNMDGTPAVPISAAERETKQLRTLPHGNETAARSINTLAHANILPQTNGKLAHTSVLPNNGKNSYTNGVLAHVNGIVPQTNGLTHMHGMMAHGNGTMAHVNTYQYEDARKRKRDSLMGHESPMDVQPPRAKRFACEVPHSSLAPLKLLQKDHPKVVLQKTTPPIDHTSTSKIMSARRRMFLEEIENTKLTPAPSQFVPTQQPNLTQSSASPNISTKHENNQSYTDRIQDKPLDYSLKRSRDDTSNISLKSTSVNNSVISKKDYIQNKFSINDSLNSPGAIDPNLSLNRYTNKTVLNASNSQKYSTNAYQYALCRMGNSVYGNSGYFGTPQVLTGVKGNTKAYGGRYASGPLPSVYVSSKNDSGVVRSRKECRCRGKPMVCSICLVRPSNHAPRAGTQGFRPPEVLLKFQDQTTAVDMWAVGVILLCVLSGRYPFFRAPDDASALAELISLFGADRVKTVATLLGRHLLCSYNKKPMDLRILCIRLREGLLAGRRDKQPPAYSPNPPAMSSEYTPSVQPSGSAFPDSAFHLLERLLDLNPHTRITAQEALKHPFFEGL